ncbi:hypothetical protein B4900_03150 [Yersinia rohdei]|nr:hypothetical protein B4900_03150 [Yersinia rohdei]
MGLGKKIILFFLPDGPYGRPFDNQYTIESINVKEDGFDIVFSGAARMCFSGVPTVIDEGCNLTITNFSQCIFEDASDIHKVYRTGEVVLSGF